MPKNTDFNIPVTVAGVKFRNPFYVASGPTTMTIEQVERINQTGWGGASLKLTIDPEPYINRYPRYGWYPKNNFLTFTAERRLVLKDLLKLIEQGRRRCPDLVLFSNITYSGDRGVAGWVNMAKKCEEAGVHINELNMCCPNMSFNVEVSGTMKKDGPRTGASLGQQGEAIAEIVRAIKSETSIPLFVKVTAEGGNQPQIAKMAIEAGADAVGGNGNRLGVPPINLDDPTSSMYFLQKEIGMACMNGEWLKPLSMRDVYSMRKTVGPKATLTATGGVSKWSDAAEMMMCGADLIGMCTATLVNGFGFMPEFIEGFRNFMKEKKYHRTKDMRDILVPAITSAPDLTIYAGHVVKKDDGLSAPCTYACPNSVPVQGYVRKVAEEEFEEAYQLIMSRSPLQSICGKVCDHPCEDNCTRGEKDEPIMIREIKRFVIEMAKKEGWKPRILNKKAKKKSKKVAVIGSGPSGLACAYDCARAGYKVTVFETAEKLGGMLTSSIPTFRLNRNDVEEEIDVIRQLGVKFKTGTRFGSDITLQSLKKDGFEAIFVGIGAHEGMRLGIPGEDKDGALSAVDFLKNVSSTGKVKTGKRIAVIGGGFTAVDTARSAIRMGAKEVYMLYRRTKDEMPATAEEIKEAEEEGVKIMYLVSPQRINGNGRVESITMLNYVLGSEDKSGRRRPLEVPGTEFELKVDTVVGAISQTVESGSGQDLRRTQWGTIEYYPQTMSAGIKGVYTGGDCARGPQDVIQAIADGKRAAVSIDKQLSGKNAILEYDIEKTMSNKENVLLRNGHKPRQYRPELKPLSPARRVKNFNEYTKPLTKLQAVAEASRCLICGCGAGCEICKDICKMFAYKMDDAKVCLDEDKCVGCGMCVQRCPNDNIEMKQTGTSNLVK